jgi:hypothetical protein
LFGSGFGFPVLEVHQTRALVMAVLKEEEGERDAEDKQPSLVARHMLRRFPKGDDSAET